MMLLFFFINANLSAFTFGFIYFLLFLILLSRNSNYFLILKNFSLLKTSSAKNSVTKIELL